MSRLWLTQLQAMMYKNWLLKRRRYFSTLCEILLPCAVMALMVLLRVLIPNSDNPETIYTPTTHASYAPPIDIDSMNTLAFVDALNRTASLQAELQRQLAQRFGSDNQSVSFLIFDTEPELEAYIKQSGYGFTTPAIYAAIVFYSYSPQWDYAIRLNVSHGYYANPPTIVANTYDYDKAAAANSIYIDAYQKDWFYFQQMVDSWIFNQTAATPGAAPFPRLFQLNGVDQVGSSDGLSYSITLMPTPAYQSDAFVTVAQFAFGLLFTLAFLWPFTRLVRNFVVEKEFKLKEGMKMMGLKNSVWWTSWFLTYGIIFLIIAAIITAMCSTTVYEHSDKGIILLYFFVFGLSALSLAALVNVFFSRAKTAATFGAVIFIGIFFPFYAVNTESSSYSAKTACCILSPACFGLGAITIAELEASGFGVTYGTWQNSVNNFDVNTCIGMMFLDSLIYLLFAWYFDKVVPSQFGTPLPPYFIFMPSYWCSRFRTHEHHTEDHEGVPLKVISEDDTKDDLHQSDFAPHFETVPAEVRKRGGLRVQKLAKTFDSDGQIVQAVRGFSLDIYEGQIIALLGHNGAGKSTVISMLTGLIPPTSGDALYYGKSIRTDLDEIRQSLGVCPQHDVLFDDLTVSEHLALFAKLKGATGDVNAMVTEIINDVGLNDKTNAQASTLSGGQKRKLSIAIALIGDSKVVILDECTSGMDVFSRRWIWNMLLKKKSDRVIILTTHFMDEADQLGDRIAIMAKGKIKCCGGSLFLKNLYGVGYTMTISKNDSSNAEGIRELVKTHISDSEEIAFGGGEISFRLPFSAASNFPALFAEMDRKIAAGGTESLGIRNYGISVTTLEEVFIRVGKEELAETEKAMLDNRRASGQQEKDTKLDKKEQDDTWETLINTKYDTDHVFFKHFRALFVKRWWNAYRDRRQWMFQVILPTLITFVGLAITYWAPRLTQPSVLLSIAQYNSPLPIPYADVTLIPPPDSYDLLRSYPPDGVDFVTATTIEINSTQFSQYLLDTIETTGPNRYIAYNFESATQFPQFSSVNIFVNGSGTHSVPIGLNFLHNDYIKYITNSSVPSISTRNYPLPATAAQDQLDYFSSGLIIGIGFSFIPAAWVAFIVKEREINVKHQQVISGVSLPAYWLSNLVWDCVNYIIPAGFLLILIGGFGIATLVGENIGGTIVGIILYGPSIATFTYLMSFFFKSHSTAQNTMILVYILTGVLLAIVSFVLDLFEESRVVNVHLKFVWRLLPHFCFNEVLNNLLLRNVIVLGRVNQSVWDMEVTGWAYVYMACEIVVYLAIVLLIEWALATPWLLAYFFQNVRVQDPPCKEDEDVAAEKERVQLGDVAQDVIQVKGLRKEFGGLFGNSRIAAVRDLWFGVREGECFGFLGVNGAGKTTALQMLTGAEFPTRGSATLSGYDILTQQIQIRRHLGYCPQSNALLETLTATETLTLFARIKGVPEEKVSAYVNAIIDKIGLREYCDRPCGGYSGGNKRKLSVGAALIGNPNVIFLDEPSTGMDPGAKRFMWNLINSSMHGRSVILTTHSMEEAEALCHRIAIMVSGRLSCLGSAQHLRSKFGRGYQIEVKTEDKEETVQAIQRWFEATFAGAELVEKHGDHIKYKIDRSMPLGEIFGEIERNKETYKILEYSCSEFSLEQIFIYFARQGSPDAPPAPLQGTQATPDGGSGSTGGAGGVVVGDGEGGQTIYGRRDSESVDTVRVHSDQKRRAPDQDL